MTGRFTLDWFSDSLRAKQFGEPRHEQTYRSKNMGTIAQ